MKRFIAVFMALLMMVSLTTNALALETWLFSMDYTEGASDAIGALDGSDSSAITLLPFAGTGDDLSKIEFSYVTAPCNIAAMTEADLQSYAEITCTGLESLQDASFTYTDAEPLAAEFVVLDGKTAGFYAVKAKWNSTRITGASADIYMGVYMLDFDNAGLSIHCITSNETNYREMLRLIETVRWKEGAAQPTAQTGSARLGTPYDYGDFTMAYTPGGNDTAGEKSADSSLYDIYPFAETGDATTSVMITWQPETMDLNALTDSELQTASEIMLEGFVAGQSQYGIECKGEIQAYRLVQIDGYTGLRLDLICSYDLASFGLDTEMSLYITYYYVPVDFSGGTYSFVALADHPDKLEPAADLLETITWNK